MMGSTELGSPSQYYTSCHRHVGHHSSLGFSAKKGNYLKSNETPNNMAGLRCVSTWEIPYMPDGFSISVPSWMEYQWKFLCLIWNTYIGFHMEHGKYREKWSCDLGFGYVKYLLSDPNSYL